MRRLFQFRLSTLLGVLIVTCCLVGYVTNHAAEYRKEKHLAAQLLIDFDQEAIKKFKQAADGRIVFTTQKVGFW